VRDGVHGMRLLDTFGLANAEGQKIYTLTKENYQAILPKLQLAPAAIADIKAAAKAGFTVTTHEKRITLNGYTGEGYIILNDQGVGAYMINGGMYGGVFTERTGNRNLMTVSILGSYAPEATERSLKSIVVGVMLAVSVTYINDAELPTAGYGTGNFLEAHLKEPLTKILNDYMIVAAAIAADTGFLGDEITTYLVVWYFYGAGATLNLNQIHGAPEVFERAVREYILPYMNNINEEAKKYGCSGYSKNDTLEINIISKIFGIARTVLAVSVQCNNAVCTYEFKLRDWFRDALDLNDKVPGYQEAVGGIPYQIHYDFTRTKQCQ